MSFEVNLDAEAIPYPSGIPSPTRVRKFEMAAASVGARGSRLTSPVTKAGDTNTSSATSTAPPMRESRFKQQIGGGGVGNSNFVDFGRVQVDRARTPAADASQPDDGSGSSAKGAGVGKSRFAAFASTEITYVKGVHEEIQSVLNDELASSQDNGPKFTAMDLARLINKVMVNLNLQPTKDQPDQPINGPNSMRHWISSSPPGEKPTLQELKSTVTMQNVLVSELGKSMQKMGRHNAELVDYNKKLISERNSAVQARDDLLKLYLKEQEEKMNLLRENEKLVSSTSHRDLVKEDLNPYERQYFDETAFLDAAVEEFLNSQRRKGFEKNTENEQETEQVQQEFEMNNQINTADNICDLADLAHPEKIQYAADMISIANHANYSSAFKVASKIQFQQNTRTRKGVKNIRDSLPKQIMVNKNYHSKALATKINNYIGLLNNAAKGWNKKVLEAKSVEEYARILQSKLADLTHSFEETLDVLAESQSLARSWRLRYEKLLASMTHFDEAEPKNVAVSYTKEGLPNLSYAQKVSSFDGAHAPPKTRRVATLTSKSSCKAFIPNKINRISEIQRAE